MKKSKYYVRVMRPTFHRAIFTVEASSEKMALRSALERAGQLTDKEWAQQKVEREQPVVEIVLSDEEAEGTSADMIAFLKDVQHAYALLQADLAEGDGSFIAPTWMRHQPALAIADVTQDWQEALTGVYEEGVEAFTAWLSRQTHPADVVDFLAEREKRRGKPRDPPDRGS